MKTARIFAALLALAAGCAAAAPMDNSFAYQGRLDETGSPVSGAYDLMFRLFAAETGGAAVAGPVTNLNVAVTSGLFSVAVDFGPGVFNGTPYWLGVSVRPAAGGAWTNLLPRQPILATPYALQAANAALAGGVRSNAVGTASLKDGAVTAV
jgi:hypothetical protein